jgi:glycine/serine hydroxymethyltransferase
MVVRIIENPNDSELKLKVREEVEELCGKFPIYK